MWALAHSVWGVLEVVTKKETGNSVFSDAEGMRWRCDTASISLSVEMMTIGHFVRLCGSFVFDSFADYLV